MKKIKIFINCSLLLITIMAILTFALTLDWCIGQWEHYNLYFESFYYEAAVVYTIIDIFSLITAILGAVMLVILNPDFFRISRLKTFYSELAERRAENKTAKAERKAAKTAEQKQARIEELEKQLNELKKDE